MPDGTVDTHVYIVGSLSQYSFTAKRSYSPPEASVDQLRQLHKSLSIEGVMIVQPSFYGTDNRCKLDATRSLGIAALAIVVIDEKTTDSELDQMQKSGVCGVRLNLATAGISDPAASGRFLRTTVDRIKARGWHIQFNTEPKIIGALKSEFSALPVPVVFDHFGVLMQRTVFMSKVLMRYLSLWVVAAHMSKFLQRIYYLPIRRIMRVMLRWLRP